jgi:hypothetical protein
VEGYRIDPDGVAGVLQSVATAAADFGTAIAGLPNVLDTVAGSAGSDGVVADALGQFVSGASNQISGISEHIEAGVYGAASATSAYLAGDEQMVLNVQAAAVKAASSGDLSFFDGSGSAGRR